MKKITTLLFLLIFSGLFLLSSKKVQANYCTGYIKCAYFDKTSGTCQFNGSYYTRECAYKNNVCGGNGCDVWACAISAQCQENPGTPPPSSPTPTPPPGTPPPGTPPPDCPTYGTCKANCDDGEKGGESCSPACGGSTPNCCKSCACVNCVAPPTPKQMYYCMKSTVACNLTSNTYASVADCEASLAKNLPGQTTGVCYTAKSACTPECVSSCTLSLTPATTTFRVGDTANLTAAVTPTLGTISSVAFVSGSPSYVSVSPSSDSLSPYITVVKGILARVSPGITISATATMNDGTTTCRDTSTVIVTAPSCTVTLTPATYTLVTGKTVKFTATTSVSHGTISKVVFNSGSAAVTLNPLTVTGSATTAQTTATGQSVNSNIPIRATTTVGDGVNTATCTVLSTVNVIAPTIGWWQVKDGDVVTNGSISSAIPGGSTFEIDGAGGYPGIPTYGDSTFTSLTPTNVSSTHWLANSAYSSASKIYNSTYFINAIPSGVKINNLTSTLDQTALNAGIVDPDGYIWFEYKPSSEGTADLTIPSPGLNLGNKKVILVVKNSDGNTYHFLYWLRAKGLINPLRDYVANGGILVETSAGAIVQVRDLKRKYCLA